MSMVTGDLVRFVAQERLDKKDADAFSVLVYEYVHRALGNLMGHASGVLSPYEWTADDDGVNYWITPTPFAFCLGATDKTRTSGGKVLDCSWDGAIVRFDPAAGSQNPKADYTEARSFARAFVSGGGNAAAIPDGISAMPYLWARPYLVDMDSDARRQWSIAQKLEVPMTMNTRQRARVEFVFSETVPDAGDGSPWVRIGKVTSWFLDGNGLPNNPLVTVISVWDNAENHAYTKETGTWYDPAGTHTGVGQLVYAEQFGVGNDAEGFAVPGSNRDFGLVKILHIVRNRLRRFAWQGKSDPEGTTTGPWWKIPKYSLSGLATKTDGLSTQMGVAEAEIDTLQASTSALDATTNEHEGRIGALEVSSGVALARTELFSLAAGILRYTQSTNQWTIVQAKNITGVLGSASGNPNCVTVTLDTSKPVVLGKKVVAINATPGLFPVPLTVTGQFNPVDMTAATAADAPRTVDFYVKQHSDLTLTNGAFVGAGDTFYFYFNVIGCDP